MGPSSPGFFELGHAIDFHQDAEEGGGYSGTGERIVPGKLPVYLVELREPSKVGHVSVHLYNVFQAGSRSLQDRPRVLERLANGKRPVVQANFLAAHFTLLQR
jgi:hypothetical protein